MDALRTADLKTLAARLEARTPLDGLTLMPNPVRGDAVAGEADSPPQRAAVLVPILLKKGEPSLLFTLRPTSMRVHPGQISFPGGGMSHRDKDTLETALREAEEEIGLKREDVDILGRLPPYHTISNYEIHPWVGVLSPSFRPVPDTREVVETFEAPVAFFLEKDSLQIRTREEGRRVRTFYAFEYGERLIWGATAAILVNLAAALKAYAKG